MTTQTLVSEGEASFIMSNATHLARNFTAIYWCEALHRAQSYSYEYPLAQYLTDLELTTSALIDESLAVALQNQDECITCLSLTELKHNFTVRVHGNCGADNCPRFQYDEYDEAQS